MERAILVTPVLVSLVLGVVIVVGTDEFTLTMTVVNGWTILGAFAIGVAFAAVAIARQSDTPIFSWGGMLWALWLGFIYASLLWSVGLLAAVLLDAIFFLF